MSHVRKGASFVPRSCVMRAYTAASPAQPCPNPVPSPAHFPSTALPASFPTLIACDLLFCKKGGLFYLCFVDEKRRSLFGHVNIFIYFRT